MSSYYGVNHENGSKQIKEMISLEAARTKLKDLFAHFNALGWNNDKIMSMRFFAACANDAVWGGHAIEHTKPCISRTNVYLPAGEFRMNWDFPKCMGQYIGMGPHQGYHEAHAATTLRVDRDGWLGDKMDMAAMRSTGWGLQGNEGWCHAGFVDAIGFVGNNSGWHNPNYVETGLKLWDEAEGASMGRVWSSDHNGYGVEIVRGTPQNWNGALSVFTNSLGGLALFDNELATVNINNVSGDDNGNALVVQGSKYERGAGGNINIAQIKSESGKRTPNRGQVVFYQMDPCSGVVTIQSVQGDCNYVDVDAMFVMNTRDNSWSMLNVEGFVGWNFRNLVHQIKQGKPGRVWGGAAYKPESFIWSSRNGGQLVDLIDLVKKPHTEVGQYPHRLGFVPVGSAFDYTNGLPKFDPTGGVTPPVDPPVEPPVDPPVEPPVELDIEITTSFQQHSSYEGVEKMIDGDPSTRWTSGRVSVKGDFLALNFKTPRTWKTISLENLASSGDNPTKVFVEVGTNGTTWSRLSNAAVSIAYGPGYIRITSSTVRSNQRVRIVADNGTKWWSVHELKIA